MKKSASLYVILGASCWGVIGIFIRNLYAFGFTPIQVTFIRSVIAVVILTASIIIKDKKLLKIKLKDIWMFLGTGIVSVVLFNICYFKCMQYCSLSVAAILLYTSPVFVMIFSAVIFKEKITKRKIAALIIAFCGCILVSGIINGNSEISGIGIILGLASGLTYGLYSIFGEFALRKYNTLTITAYTFIIGMIVMIPLACFENWAPIYNSNTWLYCIGLGIISTVIPYLLYTKGLSMTEPGRAAVLANVEPVVASIVSVFVFSEPFSIFGLLGIAAIITSAVILNKK